MTPASRRRCQLSSEQNTKNERYAAQHIQAHTLISRPRGAHMCMHMSPREMRASCNRGRVEADFPSSSGALGRGRQREQSAPSAQNTLSNTASSQKRKSARFSYLLSNGKVPALKANTHPCAPHVDPQHHLTRAHTTSCLSPASCRLLPPTSFLLPL